MVDFRMFSFRQLRKNSSGVMPDFIPENLGDNDNMVYKVRDHCEKCSENRKVLGLRLYICVMINSY